MKHITHATTSSSLESAINALTSRNEAAFLPNIAELLADGEIMVGVLYPVGCVATATDPTELSGHAQTASR